MRAATCLLGLALLSGTAAAGSLAELDRKNGFRDARFGMSPSELGVLEPAFDLGADSAFTRPSDSVRVGEATLDTIAYFFHKERLWSVYLHTKGKQNSRALLRALQGAYGPGSRPNEYLPKHVWRSAKVAMVYEENTITGDAKIIIGSIPLQAARERDKRAAAANAAGDL